MDSLSIDISMSAASLKNVLLPAYLIKIYSRIIKMDLDLLETSASLRVLGICQLLTDDGHAADSLVHFTESWQAVHCGIKGLRYCLGNLKQYHISRVKC